MCHNGNILNIYFIFLKAVVPRGRRKAGRQAGPSTVFSAVPEMTGSEPGKALKNRVFVIIFVKMRTF